MRDRSLGSTIRLKFTTTDSNGAPVAPSSAFAASDFRIYKDGSATEKATTNGITVTSPFDSVTGRHLIEIDTSNSTGDSGFWASGSAYFVELNTAKTVNSQSVSGLEIGSFSLELQTADVRKNGGVAITQSSGRQEVNVTHFGGTAGTFSSGRPEVNTTHWGGTAVGSVTINCNMTQISGDSGAADNAESFFDGTGYAGTNNVIPTVSTVTNGVTVATNSDKTGYSLTQSFPTHFADMQIAANGHVSSVVESMANNSVTASAIQGDAITAAKIAADAITEIQSGLATSANQTTILDRQAYTLAVLAGACSDPQTASETYVLTIGGSTYTVDMAGQTSTGTRTAPTLTKT